VVKIYSIGHSKHPIEKFISMLKEQDIEMLVDVRRFPQSRFNPHFNKNKLKESLEQQGIQYVHMVELGGRRNPVPESVNRGWEEPQFQGYADYMQTAEFEYALKELLIHAAAHRTAYMCAEADYHSCHRRLLSDALMVRKCEVIHIKPNGTEPHTLTTFAKVEGKRLSYPAPEESQGSLF
jgi:uncharacterized protein (DUF488 family)